MENRKCVRCLMREMAEQAGEYINLQQYLDQIDAQERTPEELYENRLSTCKECNMLLAGMCRHCGCYVELRAAVEKQSCPVRKW